jgi:hypothetical protein
MPTLQNLIDQAVTLVMSEPNSFFGFTLAVSAAIILWDVDTGVSFNLPGRGRIGGAALVAVLGSSVWFLSQGGIEALLAEIAGGIFGGIIIAGVIAFLLRNR